MLWSLATLGVVVVAVWLTIRTARRRSLSKRRRQTRNEVVIELDEVRFDASVSACSDTARRPSKRTLEAAKRLDKAGY